MLSAWKTCMIKNKIDKLGYRYHVQRGYLKGFIPHLKKKKKKKNKNNKDKKIIFWKLLPRSI